MPFDFAIFDENNKLLCLIEYQGDIHYIITGGWNNKENFENRQIRDKIKQEYCSQNNIKLIIIPYTDYNILNKEYLERVLYD